MLYARLFYQQLIEAAHHHRAKKVSRIYHIDIHTFITSKSEYLKKYYFCIAFRSLFYV